MVAWFCSDANAVEHILVILLTQLPIVTGDQERMRKIHQVVGTCAMADKRDCSLFRNLF